MKTNMNQTVVAAPNYISQGVKEVGYRGVKVFSLFSTCDYGDIYIDRKSVLAMTNLTEEALKGLQLIDHALTPDENGRYNLEQVSWFIERNIRNPR